MALANVSREGPGSERTALSRLLAIFSDVRPNEVTVCLALTLNVFLLLASYYLLKTVRESLILTENGAEWKSYLSAAQALLLLVVVPVYGYIGSRVNRIQLLLGASLFFVANLLGFWAFGQSGARVGVPFFVWVGIFNVFVVAQFWSFANDLYTEEQGKRLFPIIGLGASLGALLGARAAKSLFPFAGPYGTMLWASGGLLVSMALTWWINQRDRQEPGREHSDKGQAPLGTEGGFKLILSHRYLLLIAILIVLLNVVNSVGEYLLGKLVASHANALVAANASAGKSVAVLIGETYASFFTWVNLVGLIMQAVVVSRVIRFLGVRGTLFILPCIALGTYSLIAVAPILSMVMFGKVLENSTDYSINNTARQGLFLLTSREAKYKAKAAIDTFFWRAGDVLQAGVVRLGSLAGLSVQGFAMVNVGLVLAWLGVTLLLFREHKRLSDTREVVSTNPATPAMPQAQPSQA